MAVWVLLAAVLGRSFNRTQCAHWDDGKENYAKTTAWPLHCRTGNELRNLQWFPICLSGSNLPYRNSKWVFLCLINGGRSASLQVVSAKQHKAKAFWRSVVTGHTNPSSPGGDTLSESCAAAVQKSHRMRDPSLTPARGTRFQTAGRGGSLDFLLLKTE